MSKEQNPNTCQQAPVEKSNFDYVEELTNYLRKLGKEVTCLGDSRRHPAKVALALLKDQEALLSFAALQQGKLIGWLKDNGFQGDSSLLADRVITILENRKELTSCHSLRIEELKNEAAQRNNVVALLQKQLSDLEKELCAFQGFLATRGLSSTEGNTITQKIMLLLMSWEMKLEEAQEKNGQLAAIIQRRQDEELADAIARPLEDAMKGGQDFIHKMAQGLEAAVLRTALDCAGHEQKKVFKVLDKLLNSEDAGEFSKAQIKGRKILNAYNQAVKEHKDNG